MLNFLFRVLIICRLVISILHCPEQVGGHPETLAKYERQLGLKSTCFCEGKNPFTSVSETVSYFRQPVSFTI